MHLPMNSSASCTGPRRLPYINAFLVVCVDGSAGGLDTYTHLLRHLPDNNDAAIVIVNRVRSPATMLHEILPRSTAKPIIHFWLSDACNIGALS